MILQWEIFKAQYKVSVVDLEEVMGVPGNPPFEVVTKKRFIWHSQTLNSRQKSMHVCSCKHNLLTLIGFTFVVCNV